MTARREIAFEKWHGLENDYIVVSKREADGVTLHRLAQALCDRRCGIGADGLLVTGEDDHGGVHFQIFNADGSSAELCGNGLRCAAASHARRTDSTTVSLRSAVATHRATVRRREVDFDVAIDLVPVEIGAEAIVHWEGGSIIATLVSTGNPHAIIVLEAEVWDAADAVLDAAVATFDGQVNVHAVEVTRPGHMRMRTRERGVGAVRACATGAVAAAGVVTGGDGRGWDVEMPGGVLHVEPAGPGEAARTRGPAVYVCEGLWACPADVYPLA